jgi:pyruvate dehydrogenase E2 component (dihydrolipoamide acetyltransferase)
MAEPVLMPKQGQSVESCIITEWYKSKGDKVSKGDLLFAYETDKASFEEEAQSDGILLEVFYETGDEVPVLTNVAVIGSEGEPADQYRPGGTPTETAADDQPSQHSKEAPVGGTPDGTAASTAQRAAIPASPQQPPAAAGRDGRIIISPRAKKLADSKSVPYAAITGTGPKGRIIIRDVEKAIETGITAGAAATTAAPADTTISREAATQTETVNYDALKKAGATAYGTAFEDTKLSNIRKLIAKAMYSSLQNTAQLTHHLSADARKILQLRKKVKAMQKKGYAHNITLNDMISFATIRALQKNPDANVHFLGDTVRKFKNVHLGLAVDTERGLMVPALRNASDLSLTGLSSQLKALADSCRGGNVDPDLLASTAASFTISNLGNYGVEMFTPIINMPQAAILGVNTIIHRPAPLDDGTFGFVPFIGLSLTYDHRALDGGPATKFLADIKYEIENFNMELL